MYIIVHLGNSNILMCIVAFKKITNYIEFPKFMSQGNICFKEHLLETQWDKLWKTLA